MIQKTPEEKAALKLAKAACKQGLRDKEASESRRKSDYEARKQRASEAIRTGIMPKERILEDDYPAYWMYLYVIDEDGGKVVKSEITCTIKQLKFNLKTLGRNFENIYSCDMGARKLL